MLTKEGRIDAAAVGRRADVEDKLALLLESERWPREQLDRHRSEGLAVLLETARTSTWWAERLAPGARLEALPTLTRADLQRHGRDLCPPGDGPVVEWRTSGSTGRPVQILHGPESVGFNAASRLRHQIRFGLPGAPVSEVGFESRAAPESPTVRRVAEDPAKFLINPWRLDREALGEVHAALVAGGAIWLLGAWASSVDRWARLYQASELDPLELGARLCTLGGEVTSPGQRRRSAAVFDCEVREVYGMREIPYIASECGAGSLHVNEERVIVEIVDADGGAVPAGATGEIVATHLQSFEMPMIRYRTNDVGALIEGRCHCGRTLARLDLNVGRHEDSVAARDGSLHHARFLRTIYEDELGSSLLGHRTEQTGPGEFEVALELRDPAPSGLRDCLAERVGSYLREPVRIELDVGAVPSPGHEPKRTIFERSWGGPRSE
jgi:phenylacetate-CoA ligase